MSSTVTTLVNQPYKYGFVTDIESDTIPRGLSEDVVRPLSPKNKDTAPASPTPSHPALQIRFRHRHRIRHHPPRLKRRCSPPDFRQEKRTGIHAEIPPQSIPEVADNDRAHLASRQLSRDRLPTNYLLLRPQTTAQKAQQFGRSRPDTARNLRETRHSPLRTKTAGKCRRRCRFRQRFNCHNI